MANVKVSALTSLPVASATFTYGITNANTEGKVPIGGANGLAGLASPTFTGAPLAPTAAAGTNTTQVATTAFVQAAFPNSLGLHDPGIASPTAGDTITCGGAQLINVTAIRGAGGLLATLTLNFVDGITNAIAIITTTRVVTTLTVTGHVNADATRTVLATPSALTANQTMIWAWDASASTPCWCRMQ